MAFNSSKNGFQNETEFIKAINRKKKSEIDYYLQFFLTDLFGVIPEDSEVICYKNDEPQKYDIFIEIGKQKKRVSIKKGIKNSVHAEPISEFVHFLMMNDMPRDMVINFLKYHYADGSTNGTGEKRISAQEYKKYHQKEIDEINEFINQEHILLKAIDRFIIQGRNSKEKIDAVLYGVPEDFLWIKKEDIYRILLEKKNDYSTSIHFSHLTYQPMDRCLNYNPKYEKSRFISQIKWYSICDDIIANMNLKCME